LSYHLEIQTIFFLAYLRSVWMMDSNKIPLISSLV